MIWPIGTTLRPSKAESGITPDMVVPIAPNTQHARGYSPLHPTPFFPFPNCFHWIDNHMTIRVDNKPDFYEHDGAISLPPLEYLHLNDIFADDFARIRKSLVEDRSCPTFQQDNFHPAGTCSYDLPHSTEADFELRSYVADGEEPIDDERLSQAFEEIAIATGMTTAMPPEEDDHGNASSDPTSNAPVASDTRPGAEPRRPPQRTDSGDTARSDTTAVEPDIFGWNPDVTVGLLPLVDVWLDIDNHLTADKIPSPVDLEQEAEMIVSYVEDITTLHMIGQHSCLVGSSGYRENWSVVKKHCTIVDCPVPSQPISIPKQFKKQPSGPEYEFIQGLLRVLEVITLPL